MIDGINFGCFHDWAMMLVGNVLCSVLFLAN